MADIDYFADLRVDPQASAETDYFADLRTRPGQEAVGKGFFPEAEIAIERGAIGGVGSALKGGAAQQEAAKLDRSEYWLTAQRYFSRIDAGKEPGTIIDPDLPDLIKLYQDSTPEQRAQLREAATAASQIHPAKPVEETTLYQAGKAVTDYAATFQNAKDWENSVTVKVAEALGSSAPMIGAAVVNPALGMQAGVSMSVGEQVDKALQAGASQKDVLQAANLAFAPGATEMAPIELFLTKIPSAGWGKAIDALIKYGAVALAEGGQEAMQTGMQNLISKYVYNPKQDLTEGVAEAFGLGAAVGALYGAAGIPGSLTGEPAAPAPRPEGEPRPRYEPTPEGAAPAETILPPEEPGPPPAAEPTAPAPVAPTSKQAAVDASIDEQFAREMEVPNSPRLTEADRRSPIPNALQDEGKAAVEAATGQPSTFTTTTEINGKREVATGRVSDLVAGNKAETAAIVGQIMQGVSVPQILTETAQAAPPVSAAEVPATLVPTGVPAAPRPVIGRRLPGATLDEGMQKLKARSAAYDAEIEELASSGKSVKLVSNRDPTKRVLIGPDMSEPGMFRVTYMDKDGPSGHTVHNTMEDAAGQVIGSYHPVGNIERQVVKRDVAVTPGGREVPVVYALVEADDLVTSQQDEGGANPAYPQELQPRDRSRGTSDVQINQIAQNLDPRLLDNNVSASDGAPIISADGVVESGNGRVLGIRRAYNQNLPGAEAYRQYLDDQGYVALTGAEGMRKPVLVRIRQGQLEQGERTAFTREANERTTMALSEPEQAMADAAAMSPETLALFRGGEIAEAGNRDFVRAFMQSVVSPNEQGAMVTPDGGLSQQATRRVRAALLARAYGDADLVSALVESPDNNIKAIGNALMDVAGQWAQMRAEAADGSINPGAEVTPNLLEAVRLVQRARNEGRPLAEFVAQKDIFSGSTISPEAEAMLRLMFRNTASWTMPAGREKLAEALRFYATEARKTSAGVDLLGEKAPPASKILEEAKKRQYGQEETQAKLPGGGGVARPDVGVPSTGRAVEAQPRAQAEGRPSPAPKAPTAEVKPTLKEKVTTKRAETAATAARFPAEFNWKGSVGDFAYGYFAKPGARNEWQVRDRQTGAVVRGGLENLSAASNAALRLRNEEAVAAPKFSKRKKGRLPWNWNEDLVWDDVLEPADRRLSKEEQKQADELDKRFSSPKIAEAVALMDEQPHTENLPGYGTKEFWANRLYDWKKAGKIGYDETIRRLVRGAKTLAVDEINDSRRFENKTRAQEGRELLPMLEDYEVEKGYKALLIMGPPGAGKSSIANPIAVRMKAAISDVDEAKKVIPGYNGGIGAGAVHVESSHLGQEVTNRLLLDGSNIIIPTVGTSHQKIEALRQMLVAAGYRVELSIMDPPPLTAQSRMLRRFDITGRLIPPGYFLEAVWQPPHIFRAAQRLGRFNAYSRVTSDDVRGTRVSETSGKASILARGEEFDRTGTIRPGGVDQHTGRKERIAQIQGEPAGSEKLHQPHEANQPVKFLKSGEKPVPGPVGAPRTQFRRTQVGTLSYQTKDSFAPKAAAFLKDFRKILDGYGLKGVSLDVWQDILIDGQEPVEGLYLPDLIEVAASRGDPKVTIHHEVIHALFNLALTLNEKAILLRKSHKDWITDQIKHDYSEMDRLTQAEEGVAYAYTDWLAGRKHDGIISKSFKKIQTYLKGLYQALTAHDIRSAEDIFRQIESGKIGRRTQAGAGVEIISWGMPGEESALFMKVERARNFFGDATRKIMDAADKALTADTQQVLNEFTGWEPEGEKIDQGKMNPLKAEQIARGENDALKAKIRTAIEPVLARLREIHGPTMKVYRAQRQVGETSSAAGVTGKERQTLSWTASYDYAAQHAPKHKEGVAQEKTVLSAEVPIDANHIFWVTDRADEAEFILYNHPENQAFVDNTGKLVTAAGAPMPKFSKGYTGYQPSGPTPVAPSGMSTQEWESLSPGMRREIARTTAKQEAARPATTETVDMFEGPREQFVIPGAEKLTDAQLAQRRAEAKMQPKVAQRSVEALPLFGDQKDQLALFKKRTGNPPLNLSPHTAAQAQQVQQGFLNRGQPVDRAIRVPFDLLGGLDEQNRWRPGKRLSDKMGPAGRQGFGIGLVIGAGIGGPVGGFAGGVIGGLAGGTVGAYILGSAPAPTNGKFGWLKGIAENAKRGLVDGYGLDPAYVEAYRKSDLGKAAILREAQGILKVLSNAGVGTPEAKVLQAVLTGENVTDQDMIKLAVPIRKAIDDMGAEAVSLGLISAESFERNRGAYLHRIYTKNEVDQSNLAGWVSARMAGRRKKIIGDQLKGRGMFWDVPADRLMRDVASFQQGARGAPVLGEKFHVIDEVSSTPNLTPGGAPTEKTLRRVYLPTNEAIPAKYQGASWVDRGIWEARKAGKTTTLWRDYTKAERDQMGELMDARYTIAKTFMLMANDLSTGRFFKEVSEKAEWAQSTPPASRWMDAAEYSSRGGRYWQDAEIQWVKVPDTNIADTGGKKRWGALAGKFIRAEIWRDLNEVDIANRPGTWRVLLTQWKKNKTARNPVVHMNNVMSNVMFMDAADVRTQDLTAGIKAFYKGDANYQEALDNGAFGSDMVSQEIRDQVFKPILDEIAKQTTGAQNPFLKRVGIAGAIADRLWTWAKTADNGMLRAYQAEDQLFRMATYMRRRSQGESPQVAAMNARDQFLNYDIRAPWVAGMRNTLFPFISYTYRAVPKLAENIMHRPWKVAKYAAIAYAVNALSYLWDDGDEPPDEEKERAALRDEEQGWTWLGTPRMLRMPWRDANGLPTFLDIRRWVPAGDIFDGTQGSSALPLPAPLHFGGPLQMAFEFMLNKKAFDGEEITNELTDTGTEKAVKVANWAWQSWAPASFWTPNSWYWTRISNAIYGATDAAGHPYSVSQAALSSLGVKVKPLDVQDGIKWHMFDFKKEQNALKQEFRAEGRRLERGLISQSAFDSAAAKLMEKNQRLGERVQEFGRRIGKK